MVVANVLANLLKVYTEMLFVTELKFYYVFEIENMDPLLFYTHSNEFRHSNISEPFKWLGYKIGNDTSSDRVEFETSEPVLPNWYEIAIKVHINDYRHFVREFNKNKPKWISAARTEGRQLPFNLMFVCKLPLDYCQPDVTIFSGIEITWLSGEEGSDHMILCPCEKNNVDKTVKRICNHDGWGSPDYSECDRFETIPVDCFSPPNKETTATTEETNENTEEEDKKNKKDNDVKDDEKDKEDNDEEENSRDSNDDEKTAKYTLHEKAVFINNLFEETEYISEHLFNSALSAMLSLLKEGESGRLELDDKIAQTILSIANNLIEIYSQRESQTMKNRFTELLSVLEKVALIYKPEKETFNFHSNNLQMIVLCESVYREEQHLLVHVVHEEDVTTFDLDTKKEKSGNGYIYLPIQELMRNSEDKKDTTHQRVAVYILDVHNFYNSSVENIMYSIVVSDLRTENLTENITLSFSYNSSAKASNKRCVFWKDGNWSEDGCTTKPGLHSTIVCSCNHLSSFALMNMEGLESEKERLNIVSFVGCVISSVCLVVVILTYLSFKEIRKETAAKMLVFVCFNILMANMLYMANTCFVHYAKPHLHKKRSLEDRICKALAIALHYFLLASLHWMTANGLFLYRAVTKMSKLPKKQFVLLFFFATIFPFMFVVPTAVIDLEKNYTFNGGGLCWLPTKINNIQFAIPLAILTCCNFVIFITISHKINKTQPINARGIKVQIKGAMALTALLGLTWGFAFFAVGGGKVVFAYLFVIFNSLQGFFIFLFYCVLKPDVRHQWRKCCKCCPGRKASLRDTAVIYRQSFELTNIAPEYQNCPGRSSTSIW